jgi:AcrR family transcriptional regulator
MKRKRGPYSSPRQEERQRRILAAVRREITNLGYDALTMAQLACASEVSTKTLYNLYGSKDELLLAAVADLLGNLEQQPLVLAAEPGLPSLLAFTEAVCDQVVAMPRYAEVMARSLFRADRDHRLVDVLLRNTQRVTLQALQAAQESDQLAGNPNLPVLANLLAAHQWGMVLLWSKNLIPLAEFKIQALQSQLMSLIPVCKGSQQQALLTRLANSGELIGD